MSNNNPLVSIILPVYNTEKYIYECILSILNQSYTNFELIICDDGSTDKSREIINAFKDKRIIFKHNYKNQGKILTVNNVLPLIKGKYFSVHDADDLSDQSRFEKLVNCMMNNPDYAMCGSSFKEIDEKGIFIRNIDMPTNINEIIKTQSFPDNSNFHGPTLLIQSSIVTLVGGFYRKYYITGEDIEFCSRVCEKFKCTNLNEPLYSYRLLNTSLTKSVDAYNYINVAHIEFGKYLQKVRRQSGKDLYTSLNTRQLKKIFEKYKLEAKNNQIDYYICGIDRSIYFGFFKNAFNINLKWISTKPFDFKAYKYLITLTIKCLSKKFMKQ